VNGEEPKRLHGEDWFFIKGAKGIQTVERKVASKEVTTGFKLRNPSLASDKIPKFIEASEVNEKLDDTGEFFVWEKYDDIRSLYDRETRLQEEGRDSLEFTAEKLGDIAIENLDTPLDLKYKIYRDSTWTYKGDTDLDLTRVATWDDLDKMLVPSFALKDRPCKLTRKQSYDIIRHHVKENIDTSVARINSDYRFCFRVSKKIAIEPYTHTWEKKKTNGKSYARPKFESKSIDHVEDEVFRMTHEAKGYQDYPILRAFEGESLEGLAENIKLFLDELMDVINSKVEQCSVCKGKGNIYQTHKHK